MSAGYELARFVVDFLSVVNFHDVEWKKQKLEELSELTRRKRIRESELEGELKLLQETLSGKIERKREEEKRKIQDYKEFLDSIDEMKQKLLETFSDMPTPMVHVIHHHAKQLIDDMWKTQDDRNQAIARTRFTDFLMAVYNDTTHALVENQQLKLPTKTLEIVQKR